MIEANSCQKHGVRLFHEGMNESRLKSVKFYWYT